MKKAKEELEDTVETLERNQEVIFLFANFLSGKFSVCLYRFLWFKWFGFRSIMKLHLIPNKQNALFEEHPFPHGFQSIFPQPTAIHACNSQAFAAPKSKERLHTQHQH